MYATGYLETRSRHPVALIAALSINLAAVGVMLAYNPQVIGVAPPKETRFKEFLIPPVIVKPIERLKSDPQKIPDPRPTPIDLDPVIKVNPIEPTRPLWPDLRPTALPGNGEDQGVKLQPVPVVETPAGVDPRFIRDLQPPYPAALERAEIEGKATVRVQVGTDGRVMAIELVRADNPGFFAATKDQALRRWRFRPATRDGQPVVSWVTKTVVFKINRL